MAVERRPGSRPAGRRAVRLLLTVKRLLLAPGFIVLLLCVPLFVLLLSVVRTSDRGVVTVAVAQDGEEGLSDTAGSVLERLGERSDIILYQVYASPAEAAEAVRRGQADAAWVFVPGLEEGMERFVSGRKAVLVRVTERSDTVFTRLAREELYASLYPELSVRMFRRFAEEEVPGADEGTVQRCYEMTLQDTPLVVFGLAEDDAPGAGGSMADPSSVDEEDYLMMPVRGILAVLVFAAGVAAAIFFLEDERRGSFVWLPAADHFPLAAGYGLSAVVMAACAALAGLRAAGVLTTLPRELYLMALYAAGTAAMCGVLRQVFRRPEALSVLLPLAILLLLALCPVFMDLKGLRVAQRFIPAYHYLHAVNSRSYSVSLALCAAGWTAADVLASAAGHVLRLHARRDKRYGKGH